jgi:hypothetical protein
MKLQEQLNVTLELPRHSAEHTSPVHLQGHFITLIEPPFAQQRTAPPVVQHGPMSETPHNGPIPQPAILLQWKVTGQAGVGGGVSTKII